MHHEAYCRSQNEQQYASQRIRIVNTHLTVRKTVQPGNFSAGKTQDTERFMGLNKKHGILRAYVEIMARMELC